MGRGGGGGGEKMKGRGATHFLRTEIGILVTIGKIFDICVVHYARTSTYTVWYLSREN